MTPDQIDTAIAEFLGWTAIRHEDGSSRLWGLCPKSEAWKYRLQAVPRFHRCLNAMAEAEQGIIAMDDGMDAGCARYIYAGHLYRNCSPNQQPIMATAIQRAEALLRTISKWQEPEKLSTHCAV